LDAELGYDVLDPYAVSLAMKGAEGTTTWVFARELLREGLQLPSGDGDVHVFRAETEDGAPVLAIELVDLESELLLTAGVPEIETFLATSLSMVPLGAETESCDIDAMIDAIMATAEHDS
jgi:hypothetical protein